MPKNDSVLDIKTSNSIGKGGEVSAWAGGTTYYRNNSLYLSHDYYRGGKTSSSDTSEFDINPLIASVFMQSTWNVSATDISPKIKNINDLVPSNSSVEDL
jgi:hypothetical protein